MTNRQPPRFMRLFLLGFALGTAGLVGVQAAHADDRPAIMTTAR